MRWNVSYAADSLYCEPLPTRTMTEYIPFDSFCGAGRHTQSRGHVQTKQHEFDNDGKGGCVDWNSVMHVSTLFSLYVVCTWVSTTTEAHLDPLATDTPDLRFSIFGFQPPAATATPQVTMSSPKPSTLSRRTAQLIKHHKKCSRSHHRHNRRRRRALHSRQHPLVISPAPPPPPLQNQQHPGRVRSCYLQHHHRRRCLCRANNTRGMPVRDISSTITAAAASAELITPEACARS